MSEEQPLPMEHPEEDLRLINAYDDMVRSNVRALMSQMDMCQCEKCFLDACALVFNRQYTHYVTTVAGALLTKLPEMNPSSQTEMTVIIMEALQVVKNHPNH